MRPVLVDAQGMHGMHGMHPSQNPATFEVPSAADLAALRPGHLVKVSNRRDRFWVTLTDARPDGELAGVVRDRLVAKQRYDRGDLIHFCTRNVYDTHPPLRERRTGGFLSRLVRVFFSG